MIRRHAFARWTFSALVAAIGAACLAAAHAKAASTPAQKGNPAGAPGKPAGGPLRGPTVAGYSETGPNTSRVEQSDSQIRAYWTPARLTTAQSVEQPGQPGSSAPQTPSTPNGKAGNGTTTDRAARSAGQGSPVGLQPAVQGTSAAAAASVGASTYDEAYLGEADYTAQVGRLYFTESDGPHACSATVVGPNLILTAAHCVTDLSGNNFSNFMFDPHQYGLTAPYGTWTARASADGTRTGRSRIRRARRWDSGR